MSRRPLQEDMGQYTEDLMKYFLEDCAKIFGSSFITHALHILVYLPNDCARFGLSDSFFSCFPFEDFNLQITNSVKGGNQPIRQLIN